jgi:hypothetical protein
MTKNIYHVSRIFKILELNLGFTSFFLSCEFILIYRIIRKKKKKRLVETRFFIYLFVFFENNFKSFISKKKKNLTLPKSSYSY